MDITKKTKQFWVTPELTRIDLDQTKGGLNAAPEDASGAITSSSS